MKVLVRFLPLVAAFAVVPRAEAATFAEEVERLATPLVDRSGQDANRAVGLVVAVVTRAGGRAFGFGALRTGEPTPPDGDTYFQIGSVSKGLTGLILASQIQSSGDLQTWTPLPWAGGPFLEQLKPAPAARLFCPLRFQP